MIYNITTHSCILIIRVIFRIRIRFRMRDDRKEVCEEGTSANVIYATKNTNEIILCVLSTEWQNGSAIAAISFHGWIECFFHCLRLNLTHFRLSFFCCFVSYYLFVELTLYIFCFFPYGSVLMLLLFCFFLSIWLEIYVFHFHIFHYAQLENTSVHIIDSILFFISLILQF